MVLGDPHMLPSGTLAMAQKPLVGPANPKMIAFQNTCLLLTLAPEPHSWPGLWGNATFLGRQTLCPKHPPSKPEEPPAPSSIGLNVGEEASFPSPPSCQRDMEELWMS